ncbi:hypothetical protein HDU76_010217 [Blyttiomyces sp. JEL0837]|nr:hypothetical protein HDU76_010217 [Blyttiomyces sp. JEL0837]
MTTTTTTTGPPTTSYTIVYFDMRAKAELSRFILEKAGAIWNDQLPDWPADKAIMPFGQVPLLIEKVNGVEVFRLAQSRAIERYLARKFDLGGSTPQEQSYLESVLESYHEIMFEFRKVYVADAAVRPQLEETLYQKTFPDWINYHERLLEKSGVKGCYGTKFSYVEMVAFTILERITTVFAEQFNVVTDNWKKIPHLKDVYNGVKNDETLGKYIVSERRKIK